MQFKGSTQRNRDTLAINEYLITCKGTKLHYLEIFFNPLLRNVVKCSDTL